MFRFTIRDVLWLTVVVAMGAAWWVDRLATAAKYDQALRTSLDMVNRHYESNCWVDRPKLDITVNGQGISATAH